MKADKRGGGTMLGEFSERLVSRLSRGIEISEAEKKVAAYGIEGIISSTIGYSLVLLMGAVFGCFSEAVVFVLVFSALRKYVGGYHAKTFLACKCTVCVTFLVEMALSRLILQTESFIIGNIAGILFLITVWKDAPVKNRNKRYYEGQIEHLQKVGRGLSVFVYVFSILLYFLHREIYSIVIATIIVVTVLMVKEVTGDEKDRES